jgi:hypothetical protein
VAFTSSCLSGHFFLQGNFDTRVAGPLPCHSRGQRSEGVHGFTLILLYDARSTEGDHNAILAI